MCFDSVLNFVLKLKNRFYLRIFLFKIQVHSTSVKKQLKKVADDVVVFDNFEKPIN